MKIVTQRLLIRDVKAEDGTDFIQMAADSSLINPAADGLTDG